MALPNFLICGAPKAGTTSLYQYLRQHPEVFMSDPKETGFFHKHYDKGVNWFARHFEDHDGQQAIGEASVMTMPTPGAAARVAEVIPGARLIFLVRDPVERAYSDFNYNFYQGWRDPNLSFSQLIRDGSHQFGRALIHRGRYLKHLKRFEQYFDRSQMCVLLLDELKEKRYETVRRVYQFIGVDPAFDPDVAEQHNVTQYPKSRLLYRTCRQVWQPFKKAAHSLLKKSSADKIRTSVRSLFFERGGLRWLPPTVPI